MPYALRPIGLLDSTAQIIFIVALFIATTLLYRSEYRSTGKILKYYPENVWILFAPIYEEIIFRGFVLYGLMALYTMPVAVIASSLLFGIWHFKNIFWLPKSELAKQMAYTGLIFGPLMALATVWTGTVWLAVILHYANNLATALWKRWAAGRTNITPNNLRTSNH